MESTPGVKAADGVSLDERLNSLDKVYAADRNVECVSLLPESPEPAIEETLSVGRNYFNSDPNRPAVHIDSGLVSTNETNTLASLRLGIERLPSKGEQEKQRSWVIGQKSGKVIT